MAGRAQAGSPLGSAAACFAERPGSRPLGRGRDPERRGNVERPDERRLRVVGRQVGRRILIVDDEPSMRLLCSINLEMAGFDVSEAADGAEALARVQGGEFDLVLLDVMMPDIGGHEVARRLLADERTSGLPIVFLSARTDRDDLRLAYQLGAVDYVTKPFDPIALAARVEEILGRVERQEIESYRSARLAELE
jgi:DNA-binding response OmpR family regulator